MEKFTIGLVMGGVIGALCTANNYKIRTLVKKGQKEMQDKLDAVMDKTLDAMDEMDENEQPTEQKSKRARAKKATN